MFGNIVVNRVQGVDPGSVIFMPELYRPEDVHYILERAITRHTHQEDTISRQQLLDIAAELGISTQDLQAAEEDWLQNQQTITEKKEFQEYQQSRFQSHLAKYAIVNGFLIGLNFLTSHQLSWSLYVCLGWGVGVALQGWNTYQKDGEAYQRAFEKWRQKKQFRQMTQQVAQEIGQSIRSWIQKVK
jgi:hypothetical protein